MFAVSNFLFACSQNLEVLGCRLPLCLSSFGRFLLIEDRYTLSPTLPMLVQLETHSPQVLGKAWFLLFPTGNGG